MVSNEHGYRIERSLGGFERSIALPPGAADDDITAGVSYAGRKITIPSKAAAGP